MDRPQPPQQGDQLLRTQCCVLCGVRSGRLVRFPPTSANTQGASAGASTSYSVVKRKLSGLVDHESRQRGPTDADNGLLQGQTTYETKESDTLVSTSDSVATDSVSWARPSGGWLDALTTQSDGQLVQNPHPKFEAKQENSSPSVQPPPPSPTYACRAHFGHEDFDSDGNLNPDAIPQPGSPSGWSPTFSPGSRGATDAIDSSSIMGAAMGTQFPMGQTDQQAVMVKQEIVDEVKQEVFNPKKNLGHSLGVDPSNIKSEPQAHASEDTDSLQDHKFAKPVKMASDGAAQQSSSGGAHGGAPAGSTDSAKDRECSVCLQEFSHPIRLPCGHMFCFLCAKGFANQHNRCAFCRAVIPAGYMNLPEVVPEEHYATSLLDSKFVWFYEGSGQGWWQFEERHSDEIEEAYLQGKPRLDLLISGFMYAIDLRSMTQFRRDRPQRTRRLKRDLFSAPRKGIAGLREDLLATPATDNGSAASS